MPVPFSLMSSGYQKTVQQIRKAFEDRVTNATRRLSATPSYHRGTPDPAALPDEDLGVWVDWTHVGRDPDEPYEATMLMQTWKVFIIGKDEGNDAFGGDAPLVERIWGEILKTLTETTVDLGLDGACDFVPTPDADNFRGTLSAGDRRVQVIEMTVEVHWQMEMTRC